MSLFLLFLFLLLTICILTHSALSLFYALLGLQLWFDKMIPALLPFMILSGMMIRMGLTEGFTTLCYPVIRPVFRVSRNVCYGMLMGFLCGFPMGAKTASDLRERNLITEEEANFLLAFTNNIGPVYFCSFVLPLLGKTKILPYVFGMYGIPLLYGLALRYTCFRKMNTGGSKQDSGIARGKVSLLLAMDDSIVSSLHSILSLGGYMILFNLLNILPHIIGGSTNIYLAPILEISGGLSLLKDSYPLYTLLLLPFGGLSCIAQTQSCIRNTKLSLRRYCLHKAFLTFLVMGYYFLWFLLFPESFLS